jgi:NAD(P)-dependent dehydrogenase (short-subunit alcohol dehydrogenase family)
MPSPIVILTGASRGLGLAVLQLLLKHNARVTALSRSLPDDLRALQSQYADQLLIVQGDVSKPEDNVSAVKQTVHKWGGIDSLILNAGSIEPGKSTARLDQSVVTYPLPSSLVTVRR